MYISKRSFQKLSEKCKLLAKFNCSTKTFSQKVHWSDTPVFCKPEFFFLKFSCHHLLYIEYIKHMHFYYPCRFCYNHIYITVVHFFIPCFISLFPFFPFCSVFFQCIFALFSTFETAILYSLLTLRCTTYPSIAAV